MCRKMSGIQLSGQRAAAIQTLLGTAKLNGIDPSAEEHTLEKLPIWLYSRIDELLPTLNSFPP